MSTLHRTEEVQKHVAAKECETQVRTQMQRLGKAIEVLALIVGQVEERLELVLLESPKREEVPQIAGDLVPLAGAIRQKTLQEQTHCLQAFVDTLEL